MGKWDKLNKELDEALESMTNDDWNRIKSKIETHQWGYIRIVDSKLIATCIAKTYFEAVDYFAEYDLLIDDLYEIRIIPKLKSE